MAKGTKETLTLKVERKSKFGILFNNAWFNISQYGDASLDSFEVGKSYKVSVSYSGTGKAYIEEVLDGNEKETHALPKTEVEQTKASKGDSPVRPAGDSTDTHAVDSLSTRDIYMAAQAAMKSTLESPTVHYLATTLPSEDMVPDLIRRYAKLGVDIVLEIVAEKRG